MVTTENSLAALDALVIACYFVLVLGVALGSTIFNKKENGNLSTRDHFLGGNTISWLPIGASIYASNIGAPMFIGLAGAAAVSGFAVVTYEWHAVFMLLLLGWFFSPIYICSGAFTGPEYLEKRYGGQRLRICMTVLSLVRYILINISMELYAGALFMQLIIGWNIYYIVGLILILTGFYTALGGLKAVIYTDTLQTLVLVIGTFILMTFSIAEIGGPQQFQQKFYSAMTNNTAEDLKKYGNHSCGVPNDNAFHIFRPLDSNYPWLGMTVGLVPLAAYAWCSDQVMIQRSLAAKNLSHAKGGVLLSGYLKILPFVLFIVPGMVSRILFPEEVACAMPEVCSKICGNPSGCSNIAYPLLVVRVMPHGLRGLMLAAMLSALMSSLTSIFNSASTMVTMDIWRLIRPDAGEKQLLFVGRVTVVIVCGFSLLWLPVIQAAQGSELWSYCQSIAANTAPPASVVYVLGMIWKGATEEGAFWGLVIGLGVGMCRMVLDVSYKVPHCGSGLPDNRPDILVKVHFLHFAILLTGISVVVMIAVSLFTKSSRRNANELTGVTWWTLGVHPNNNNRLRSSVDKYDNSTAPLLTDEDNTIEQSDIQGIDLLVHHKMTKTKSVQTEVNRDNVIAEKHFIRVFLNANAMILITVMLMLFVYFR